jgi:hypothetical protein
MKAFVGIFVLLFAGIAITAESLEFPVALETQVGVSSMSCGVSASAMESKDSSNPLSSPDGLPGPAPPKLKGSESWGGVGQQPKVAPQSNNSYCYTNTWQAVRGQPVRNVVRFFHNRKPLRRFIGRLFGRRCY